MIGKLFVERYQNFCVNLGRTEYFKFRWEFPVFGADSEALVSLGVHSYLSLDVFFQELRPANSGPCVEWAFHILHFHTCCIHGCAHPALFSMGLSLAHHFHYLWFRIQLNLVSLGKPAHICVLILETRVLFIKSWPTQIPTQVWFTVKAGAIG